MTGLSALLLLAADPAAAPAGLMSHLGVPGLISVVVAFLFLNGWFVALEFAIVSLRRTKVDELVKERKRGASAVRFAKDHLDDCVASAQLGITIASLVIGASEPAFEALLYPYLAMIGLGAASHPVAFFVAMSAVTVLHVVTGEQVPKMLAIQYPARVALITAPSVNLFQRMCKPVVWGLSKLTRLLLRLIGLSAPAHAHHGQVYSEEEIEALLGLREAAGLAEAAESEMISKVFSFFDMVATQVMVPRTEMVCLPTSATLKDVVRTAAVDRHERYPVYTDNLDHIQGIVLLKDLIGLLNERSEAVLEEPVTLILREVLNVPGSLKVNQLMAQMKKARTRLAVVLDEFGGTAGMVTYGDLLERIAGEVEEVEVHEADEADIQQLNETTLRVSGLVLIEDVEEALDVNIEDEHNDTIGGTVFSILGRRPEVGDEVKLQGLKFRVESMDGLRIDRLLVEREAAADAGSSAQEPATVQ